MNDRIFSAKDDEEHLVRLSDQELAVVIDTRAKRLEERRAMIGLARERLEFARLRLQRENDEHKAKSDQLVALTAKRANKIVIEARLDKLRASRLRWWLFWAMPSRYIEKKSLTAELMKLIAIDGLFAAAQRWLDAIDAALPEHREINNARAQQWFAADALNRCARERERRMQGRLRDNMNHLQTVTDDRLKQMVQEFTELEASFRARVDGSPQGRQALKARDTMKTGRAAVQAEIRNRAAKRGQEQASHGDADDSGANDGGPSGDGNGSSPGRDGDNDDDDGAALSPNRPKG